MLAGVIEDPPARALEQTTSAANIMHAWSDTPLQRLSRIPWRACSTRWNMRTRARSGFRSLFVGRDLAVVDPLLVHPFPAEPFLSRERVDHARRRFGIDCGTRPVLSKTVRRTKERKHQRNEEAKQQFHGWRSPIRGATRDHPLGA